MAFAQCLREEEQQEEREWESELKKSVNESWAAMQPAALVVDRVKIATCDDKMVNCTLIGECGCCFNLSYQQVQLQTVIQNNVPKATNRCL